MKKIFALLACSLFFFACTEDYDDTTLRNDVANLKDRVAKLESICKELNGDINALNEIVAAFGDGTTIDSIIETEGGYYIRFSDGKSITIRHGEKGDKGDKGDTGAPGADGEDGVDGENGTPGADGVDGTDGKDGNTPVIGVKEEDGTYYWTVDGEWLLDQNGNKVKAEGKDGEDGKDGTVNNVVVPQLKAEEGYWWLSTDNGSTWEKLCAVADAEPVSSCIFTDVVDGEREVTFVLADGSSIVLPKAPALKITLAAESYGLLAGQTAKVGYTVTGARGDVQIEVISTADVKAKAVATTATEGVLEIVCSNVEAIDEYTKVLIFAADEARTAMAALAFEKGAITVADAAVSVEADATEAVVRIDTNLAEYRIEIEEAAQSWVSYLETRAMRTDSVVFTLEPNSGAARSATVKFIAGDKILTAVISQAAGPDWVKPSTTVKELIAWAEAQNAELATTNNTTVELAKCAVNLDAYIAMNNKGGNYYQMLAVTDNTGEAGTGIALYNTKLNDTTGENFPIGKKISVSLANLVIKNYNGMYEIMTVNRDEVFTATVSEEAAVEMVIPEITVAEANSFDYMSMYVKVKDVKTTASGTWVVNNNSTTTEIQDVNTSEVLNVYATKYAAIAAEAFDAKSGAIMGVIGTRNSAANIQPQFVSDVADFKAEATTPEPELEAVTIDKIKTEGNYKTSGTVIVAGTQAYLVADATGIILVYHYGHTRKVGEKITIEGVVSTYGGCMQFENTATVTVESEGNAWTHTPAKKDGAALDAMLEAAQPYTIEAVEVEGTLSLSGANNKFANLTIEGSVNTGSIKYLDNATIADFNNKKINVKGYFVGSSVSGSTTYINIFPYEVTAVDGGNEGEGGETTPDEGEGGETTPAGARYEKVTAAPADWSGKYLIVYEGDDSHNSLVLNGSLTTIDAEGNKVDVTITNGVIAESDDIKNCYVTIAAIEGGYSIQTASGYYIGGVAKSNKLSTSTTDALLNTISYDTDNVKIESNTSVLRYNNAATNGTRFRYFKSTSYTNQQAIQLYKYIAE